MKNTNHRISNVYGYFPQIISRNDNPAIEIENMKNVLFKLEYWLYRRKNSSRMIDIFGKFNDTSNLLFKDTTIGLRMESSNMKNILEYEELLENKTFCSSARSSQMIYCNYVIFGFLFMVILLNHH